MQFEIKDKDQFSFSPSDIPVTVENVLLSMQMQLKQADADLIKLIEQFITACQIIAAPTAAYRIIESPQFDNTLKELKMEGLTFALGKNITNLLKKSEKVLVYAVTIGFEVEKLAKQKMEEGNTLDSFIYDIIGSEMAENTGILFHQSLEKKMNNIGLKVSNRFSPGYCDWNLNSQHNLFSLLGDLNCGISLTNSSLMIPVKSVSGIIGIGSELKRLDYTCRICNDKSCLKRKV